MYDTHPGKLPALLERFRTGEMKLFEKHGITIVGFWTNLVGGESGVLYYMVGYPNLAAREKCWEGFRTDPAWHTMREESERDGSIVKKVKNMLLAPTDFSPLT
jgi:hypothetical protein